MRQNFLCGALLVVSLCWDNPYLGMLHLCGTIEAKVVWETPHGEKIAYVGIGGSALDAEVAARKKCVVEKKDFCLEQPSFIVFQSISKEVFIYLSP